MIIAVPSRFLKTLLLLDLEERILCAGSLIALTSLFLPWISGDWPGGESVAYNGIGFYTSFLGVTVLLLHLVILIVSLVPLATGKQLLRKRYKETLRLCCSAQATILVLAALSVLMSVTLEFTRMEMRYGIYVCLMGCLISLFEAIVRFIEQRKSPSQETFHHPEDHVLAADQESIVPPPPPPPPPPAPEPEDHRLYP